MVSLRDFCNYLEALYPVSLSESYDNCGLLLSPGDFIYLQGVLTTLDVNCEVVKEAITKKCNVILCHHPVLFKPLRCLNSSTEEQRVIDLAIKNDISIYCAHTNLDNSINGINYYIAKKFGLSSLKPIEKRYRYDKIDLFVNQEVLNDGYDFLINEGYLLEDVEDIEGKQEAIFYTNSIFYKYDFSQSILSLFIDKSITLNIVNLIEKKYPKNFLLYRRDVDFLFQEGCGAVGTFSEGIKLSLLLEMVGNFFCNKNFKYTTCMDLDSKINKLAICSGSGASLLKSVIKSQADVYITSDLKYHDFLDNYKKLSIVDVGHYDSEVFVKKNFKKALLNMFPSLSVFESEVNTNPVRFYI